MSLFSFLIYVFVMTFTPGPNNIMAMVTANQQGFKRSFCFCSGVGLGFFVIMIACSYFNLMLKTSVPKIECILTVVGSLYMLYLVVKVFISHADDEDNEKGKNKGFFSGMLLQFINPKVFVFGLTVIASFVIPFYHSNMSLILFSLFLAGVGLLAPVCWSVFGCLFKRFLTKYQRGFNIAMALLLLYSAAALYMEG
ncbi:amino acid transporter LysE [Pullulanibacillus camelliae]|uniref:Amino acid transporter LysE n=1 Tax=Pullulanibacillus camelliae TaxID=1707096 RepID=A0A8J2VNS0_9BACL|nr:LysE family transporter [Pullulanibacillus camelliae]GGE31267.1 amino acid transporter LysE [Pullulanibacillus camelliae]